MIVIQSNKLFSKIRLSRLLAINLFVSYFLTKKKIYKNFIKQILLINLLHTKKNTNIYTIIFTLKIIIKKLFCSTKFNKITILLDIDFNLLLFMESR